MKAGKDGNPTVLNSERVEESKLPECVKKSCQMEEKPPYNWMKSIRDLERQVEKNGPNQSIDGGGESQERALEKTIRLRRE